MLDNAFLIPLLPLLGFGVLAAVGRRAGDPSAGWIGASAVGGSFLCTLVAFLELVGKDDGARSVGDHLFTWIQVGGFRVDAGLLLDPLSVTMALFVTGVGFLIHVYSIGYMHGDERFHRFFVYLNLFVFSMLMLILGDSLLLTFLGWEGVGACSYLLISFWFERESAASAGKKAFVVNRIGDFGFMIAMFLCFATFGTLQYAGIIEGAEGASHTTVTAIALLLFVGACGKSAQLPLFVWLPDAMEGPTPVSALIHAATMVTAGVYLMARVAPLLALTPDVGTTIAVVGAVTALFAATVACAQDDIKRVLAYSTISQLGYMFLAVGSGAYVAAIFHMVTHAFFKALLFLGAGSVIHGLHDEQDMKRMGALKRWMPVTSATFIIGWLAIAGVPPFAGFWSKDDILLNAYDKSAALWAVGLVTALLTAYYMSRQVFLVFYGGERWRTAPAADKHELTEPEPVAPDAPSGHEPAAVGHAGVPAAHGGHGAEPHESPWLMAGPLVVLAGLSVIGGVINLPFGTGGRLEHWLEPVFGEALHDVEATSGTKLTLAAVAVAAAAAGIAFAYATFMKGRRIDAFEPAILKRAWGIDALYAAVIVTPGRALSAFAAYVVDARIIDGVVDGMGSLVRGGGTILRRVQTGYVRNYALGVAFGATVLLGWVMVRSGGV
ncbi:MAG TPA: NADH-quinone oxidoreductase subunit L [Acidimicrobiales bacterium]|nr:NADH-quinone oxidoreductase subunit L [Acidimicrobiales bacterium]